MQQFKIRRSVFETNSSSVHVLAIANNMPDTENLPKEVVFGWDEYGWEFRYYDTVYDKASYLYTLVVERLHHYKSTEAKANLELLEWCRDVTAILNSYGVEEVKFRGIKYLDMNNLENSEMDFKKFDEFDHYIDHGSEYSDDLVKSFVEEPERLIRFLFSEDSAVSTGNDNSDFDIAKVPDNTEKFFKGN